MNIQEFYGEIIDFDAHTVEVLCLIDKENKRTQLRKFSIEPFNNHIPLNIGGIISIKTITSPGFITIEFTQESDDKRHLFEKPDFFEKLKNSAFFKEG